MVEGIFGSGPASRITRGLWQGGFPRASEGLHRHFDVIVLCARELQPDNPEQEREIFPEVEVVRAPMEDEESGPTENEALVAFAAANRVVAAITDGKCVLVSCAAGRNRSGLVSAIALTKLYGISGKEAAERVRANRKDALTNRGFSKFLEKLP